MNFKDRSLNWKKIKREQTEKEEIQRQAEQKEKERLQMHILGDEGD